MLRKYCVYHALLLILLQATSDAQVTPEVCGGMFQALNFNLSDFSRFPDYFNDNSSMTLAQAGTYIGVESITEYVAFASSLSPYIKSAPVVNNFVQAIGFDPNSSTCTFHLSLTQDFTTDVRFSVPTRLKVGAMFKIVFDSTIKKVSKIFCVLFRLFPFNFFRKNIKHQKDEELYLWLFRGKLLVCIWLE